MDLDPLPARQPPASGPCPPASANAGVGRETSGDGARVKLGQGSALGTPWGRPGGVEAEGYGNGNFLGWQEPVSDTVLPFHDPVPPSVVKSEGDAGVGMVAEYGAQEPKGAECAAKSEGVRLLDAVPGPGTPMGAAVKSEGDAALDSVPGPGTSLRAQRATRRRQAGPLKALPLSAAVAAAPSSPSCKAVPVPVPPFAPALGFSRAVPCAWDAFAFDPLAASTRRSLRLQGRKGAPPT